MIRQAQLADAAALAHVHRSSRAEVYAQLGPQRVITDERWVEILTANESRTWLWELSGIVAGFASVAPDGVLLALYVLPGMQGQRIGTALLDVAVGHGARELWVYEDNPGARRFYERHGWVEVPDSLAVDEDWLPAAPALIYRLDA